MSDSDIKVKYTLVEKPPELDANGVPIVKPDPVSQIIDLLVEQMIREVLECGSVEAYLEKCDLDRKKKRKKRVSKKVKLKPRNNKKENPES